MHVVHAALAALVLVFVVLRIRSRRAAWRYARLALLTIGAVVVVSPFIWLLAAIFKDKAVLNEYVLWPPPDKWSSATLNLDNFRKLFKGRPSLRGTVYFWEYVLNSSVYATVGTTLQLVFSSLGGYALAKYHFRGK